MAAAIARPNEIAVSRCRTSVRFYAERNLAPVSGAIGPGYLVAVRKWRTIHQTQGLLDPQPRPSVEPMAPHNNPVPPPVTIRLVPVLPSPARPHLVAAAPASATTWARPD